MNKKWKFKKINNWLLACSGFIGTAVLWHLLASLRVIPQVLLPSPSSVLSATLLLLKNGQLLNATSASFVRILIGFFLSALVALPAGLLIGFSKNARAVLTPLLAFIRYIPPSAFIPLMIVWLGISEAQKISVVFLAIAPYLCLMIADTAANTKPEIINSALTLGASRTQIFWKIILPHSLPAAVDSGRIMMGASWSFVIISEIVGSNTGLGHLITESQRYLKTPNIFSAIIVIGIIGLASDLLLLTASKNIFPWFYNAPHQ